MRQTGETWDIGGDWQLWNVHLRGDCAGSTCPFHKPTEHHMRDWPVVWRPDRNIIERQCEHGVGHPDPDNLEWMAAHGDDGTHGCDGCCGVREETT